MSICKGCGTEIIWIKTPRGKNMPCDPELIETQLNQVTVLADGQVGNFNKRKGYRSHWVTCSKAKAFK